MFQASPKSSANILQGAGAIASALLTVVLLVSGPTTAGATDLTVDQNDAGCDDVAGTPYCSISAAVAAAVADDVIMVRTGLYSENVDFNGKAITLQSESGPTATEINGQGGTTVVIGPNGQIEGFLITGGVNTFGAGMAVNGAGSVIKGNIFDGNSEGGGGYGAGIGGNSASPTIDGNVFRNNSCDSQFLSGVVSFINSSSPLVINNLFVNNNCRGLNMTLPASGQPQVLNNTFVGNPAGIYFDRRIAIAGQTYRNNIVFGNDTGIEVNFGDDTNNPVFEDNDVFGNTVNYSGITDQTGASQNFSADPLFADSANDDYRLLPTSPAIDAAIAQQSVIEDILSIARPIDGDGDTVPASDLGAYEASPPTANAGTDLTVNVGSAVTLDASASSDLDGTIASYGWTQTAGAAVTLNNAQSAAPSFTAPATAANLTFQLTVMDDLGFVATDEVAVAVVAPPAPPPPKKKKGGGTSGLAFLGLLLGIVAFRESNRRRPIAGSR